MKIALTGAHGTGKTTLTRELVARIQSQNGRTVTASREVPRIIIDAVDEPEFFRRGNNSLSRQLLILLYQLLEDDEQRRLADIVVCDRTIVDHLAYTEVQFSNQIGDQERTVLLDAAARWLKTYDHIFYLPIEFKVEDDGVREGDVNFQVEIDKKLLDLYAILDINAIEVRGTVEERANLIISTIGG